MTTLKTTLNFRRYFQAISDTIFPRECPVCGRILACDERYICRDCFMKLPRTFFEDREFNDAEQLFAGKTPIQRASGYFFYRKKSPYTNILIDIKYHNMPKMGEWFGEEAAKAADAVGFFDGIDAMIPVPMHSSKLASRGYNQSVYIANGISKITNIPVIDNIIAIRPHDTQTRRGITERWENAQGLYDAVRKSELENKHILLVDDILTTGATLISCAKTIENIPGITISAMTLAVSKLD